MHRTAVLNVVGLTRDLIGKSTPNLRNFCSSSSSIQSIAPAVTCSMQTCYLTGKMPKEHGIVGNGWYFRNLDQVWLWRQSNRLVQSKSIWHEAKRRNANFTCVNTFWWYAMATEADVTLTPRPLYCADGKKLPDCYSYPENLRHELQKKYGMFPLFNFWGPKTSIKSSEWIAQAAKEMETRYIPTLNLVYLPHLDYCLQRVGPKGEIENELKEIDAVCGDLIGFFQQRNVRVVVLSEYGISEVNQPVHINRVLREAGCLSIKNDLGKEYLDTGTSKAFAVADHQIAHIYVRKPEDITEVRQLCESISGVSKVLDAEGKKAYGLDHERSGELVLLAEENAWFSYYFWLDDQLAPDYARLVDIHNKPGYDPVELFLDPKIKFPMLKVGSILVKKMLGFRYTMDVIPLDSTLVKGSHGLPSSRTENTPIFASDESSLVANSQLQATDIYSLLLEHVFSS